MTRKITRGIANITQGLESCLFMGNLDSLRDWGHARDYVKMQWLMLQQEEPDDFVIATGQQYSIRDFIKWAAEDAGLSLEFSGNGLDEVGRVTAVHSPNPDSPNLGDIVVRVDERYFRPTEVETLLGDPSKAQDKLGWSPDITAREMCAEMVKSDLISAKKKRFLEKNGYTST